MDTYTDDGQKVQEVFGVPQHQPSMVPQQVIVVDQYVEGPEKEEPKPEPKKSSPKTKVIKQVIEQPIIEERVV